MPFSRGLRVNVMSPMHFMNYRETKLLYITVLTMACISALMLGALPPPPHSAPRLSVTILFSPYVFTFSFSLTRETIDVRRFVCTQVISIEIVYIELCSAERLIPPGLCIRESLAVLVADHVLSAGPAAAPSYTLGLLRVQAIELPPGSAAWLLVAPGWPRRQKDLGGHAGTTLAWPSAPGQGPAALPGSP